MLLRLLIGVPVAVLGTGAAAYYLTKRFLLQSRVPDGFPQAKELKEFLSIIKTVKILSKWGAKLGLGHKVLLMRSLFDWYGGGEAEAMSDNYLEVSYVLFNNIEVKLYIPRLPEGCNDSITRAGMVFLHGGGWAIGSAAEMDGVTRQFATELGIVVASVNYRMSPEVVYPVPLDDCVEATKYFIEHAQQWKVDPKRVCVAGDSAGGNLSAAVSLRLRDEKYQHPLKLQVLIYPALQAVNFNTVSYKHNADDPYLDIDFMIEFLMYYAYGSVPKSLRSFPGEGRYALKHSYMRFFDLPSELDHADRRANMDGLFQGDPDMWDQVAEVFGDPYFSPLLAEHMNDLPHTFLATCEQDVLKDEGFLYAARLRQDGVTIQHNHYQCLHALLDTVDLDYAQKMMSDMISYLRLHL